MSVLVLGKKTLDKAAKASYEIRTRDIRNMCRYEELPEIIKKREHDAAFAVIDMAVRDAMKDTEGVFGKGSAHTHAEHANDEARSDVDKSIESVSDRVIGTIRKIEERSNIINYIAYGVSIGIPSP